MPENKILVVDDDQNIVELLCNFLELFGFSYDTAENGFQALEKLKTDQFTIVITDMIMPKMGGMELLKHVRLDHPQIDVIVITGYDRTFTYTDVIKAGASDFITKPFDADELQAKLNRIVREQELLRQLEHLSISDGLTNLFNRRYFDLKIAEESQRAHRQSQQVYLLLLDVDSLKDYNDQLGHQAGDALLQSVGETLRHFTRENVDWPCRYGGDEFSLILTQVTREQAQRTADRILEKFNQKQYPITGLSIGVAQFIRHEDRSWEKDISDLINRADKALYTAKNSGKNRVVFEQAQPQ